MFYGESILYKVKLTPVSERAGKILKRYQNIMYLMEYDEYKRPMCIAPSGKAGIYCVSPDGFWQGWFVLDQDVLFEKEQEFISDSLQKIVDSYNLEKEKHAI